MSTIFLPLLARPRNRGWGGDGEMWYQDADGIWQSIPRPPDWASIPYFLGLDQTTGYPAWLALPGVVTYIVRGAFISSTLQLFPPSVSRIVTLPLIGPTAVLYPPLLESVGLPFFSTTQLFPPTVAEEQAVTGGTIAAGTALFAPTVALAQLDITGGTIASTQVFAPAVALELAEPWGTVAQQSSLSSGRLVLSGLNLTSLLAARLYVDDVTVTSDDSQIYLRLIIDGVEQTSSYEWANIHVSTAGAVTRSNSISDSNIVLTRSGSANGVGNASTEGFDTTITIFNPTGAQPKGVTFTGSYVEPGGGLMPITNGVGFAGAGATGAITGFVVYGSSDLTGGTLTLLGVD